MHSLFRARSRASLLAVVAVAALGTNAAVKPALAAHVVSDLAALITCNSSNACQT